LTRIKILKYGIENSASAGDKSVPSEKVGGDTPGDTAGDKSVASDVPSNPSIPEQMRRRKQSPGRSRA
jgi:hypothetical protein